MSVRSTGTRCRHSAATRSARPALEVLVGDRLGEGGGDERGGAGGLQGCVAGSRAVERELASAEAQPELLGERQAVQEMVGSPGAGPRAGEQVGVARRLAAVAAQPELGDDDRVSLHGLARAWVRDQARGELALDLVELELGDEVVQQGVQSWVTQAMSDLLVDVDAERTRSFAQPGARDVATLLEAVQRALARVGVAVDRQVAIEPPRALLQLGERRIGRELRGARELEALDLLQAQLPDRAGVFEGVDADHERSSLRGDLANSHRRASSVQRPMPAIPRDEMTQLAGARRSESGAGCAAAA